MNAGIDIGYNETKVKSGERLAAFKSVVGSPERSRFSLNGNGDDTLLRDSQGVWLVGEGAVTQSRWLNRREDADWTTSADYYRLMLAAFGQVTTGTAVKLTLVSGLPVAYYEAGKTALRDRFLGQHRVAFKGRTPQKIEVVQCRIIPQPFGTVIHLAMSDSGKIVQRDIAEGPTGVIDIGGKTSNLLSVQGFSEISRETTSVNTGAWDVVRAVRDHLSVHYSHLELRDHELMDLIRRRETFYFGERLNLGPVIDEAVAQMSAVVIAAATQLWSSGAKLKAILVTGGGAYLLGDHLRRHFPHAHIVEKPQFANVIGYWKFANLLAGA